MNECSIALIVYQPFEINGIDSFLLVLANLLSVLPIWIVVKALFSHASVHLPEGAPRRVTGWLGIVCIAAIAVPMHAELRPIDLASICINYNL